MYQALYRKYRPKNFDEVVGQEFVIQTLKNAILNNKISHAYMFFGPRGIGKTTIAKILSRAINCMHTEDGNPCEKCENCQKSLNSVDIIEIDAASNNGVDEIREIKSKVNIVPSELKYKVYIIDEVHMLTTGAFNALLKTLEEPPKHVIFILATTDPQKVTETIISRCQCYSFKRIKIASIIQKLREICDKETIDIEDSTLELIADYSDGGLRDSIGLLDKLSSYKNDKITDEDFYEINDMVSTSELENFKDNIINSCYEKVIEIIKKYNDSGKNLIEITKQLIYVLRNNIINTYVRNKNINQNTIDLLNLLNDKFLDIKKSGNPRIYIEVILLKYMNEHQKTKDSQISQHKTSEIDNYNEKVTVQLENNKNQKEEQLEKQNMELNKNEDNTEIEFKTEKMVENGNIDNSNIEDIINIRINNVFAEASKEEKKNDLKKINSLNEYVFNQEYGHIVSEILNASLRVSSSSAMVLSYEYNSVLKQNLQDIEKITEIYNKLTESDKKIAIITDEKWEKLKKEYVENLKNGKKYDIIEEPDLVIQHEEEASSDSALDLFKDIVEIS